MLLPTATVGSGDPHVPPNQCNSSSSSSSPCLLRLQEVPVQHCLPSFPPGAFGGTAESWDKHRGDKQRNQEAKRPSQGSSGVMVKAVQGPAQTKCPQEKASGGGTQFRVTPSVSESHLRSVEHALESLNSAGSPELNRMQTSSNLYSSRFGWFGFFYYQSRTAVAELQEKLKQPLQNPKEHRGGKHTGLISG